MSLLIYTLRKSSQFEESKSSVTHACERESILLGALASGVCPLPVSLAHRVPIALTVSLSSRRKFGQLVKQTTQHTQERDEGEERHYQSDTSERESAESCCLSPLTLLQ